MAPDAEDILKRFEEALTDVLQMSHSEDGVPSPLRSRLAQARAAAYKARAENSITDRDYQAALDRAFAAARQTFE